MGKQTAQRLIHGVALNDADYPVCPRINGKQRMCPYYSIWKSMLHRVLSPKEHRRSPSYSDTSVVQEWLTFSNFKAWMEKQDWRGKQLDKDILVPGNRVYGPETCCFVPNDINSLINLNKWRRGDLPIGVCREPGTDKFVAQISVAPHGNRTLGAFNTPKEAHAAYLAEKVAVIIAAAKQQQDKRVADGLRAHAVALIMEGY